MKKLLITSASGFVGSRVDGVWVGKCFYINYETTGLKNRYLVIAAPDGWSAQNDTHDVGNDTQLLENDTHISDIPKKAELDKWIEIQIRKNPKITTEKLATMSQRSIITIKRHIAKLDNIRFVGSGFSGHWEVID